MAVLPIPGEIFWTDFAQDIRNFDVFRNGEHIAILKGLKDPKENLVFFKPNVDLQLGDVLCFNNEQLTISRIENETYEGETHLISVHG